MYLQQQRSIFSGLEESHSSLRSHQNLQNKASPKRGLEMVRELKELAEDRFRQPDVGAAEVQQEYWVPYPELIGGHS